MIYLLGNPKANNNKGEQDARNWAQTQNIEYEFVSVLGLDVKRFFDSLKPEDEVVLTGGDGTLNHFANDIYGYEFKNPVYYVKCGSGNDFYRDNKQYEENGKINLVPFLKNLPLITVNGMKRRFLNGIGYGIDGETCRVGEEIRKSDSDKPINYTKIAIGLLLGKYKLKKATVVVDGVESSFKNVWFASTMKGRYYGGGMMVAPNQERFNEEGLVSVCTIYKRSRIGTLLRFPSLNKGEHIKKKDWVTIQVGKKVTITFDQPCALQIDGEVVENVLTYSVEVGV